MFTKYFHIHFHIWACEFNEAECHRGYRVIIETEKLICQNPVMISILTYCKDLALSSTDVG